jgi:hypothetical protein
LIAGISVMAGASTGLILAADRATQVRIYSIV